MTRMIAIVLVALLALACDNPVGVDEHPGEDVAGVRVSLAGTQQAQVLNGVVTGNLTVASGATLEPLVVSFLAEDGDVFSEEDTYLEAVIANTVVAEFVQDPPGEFGGALEGKTTGSTTIVLKLMHGAVGSGHADFTSEPIPVEVTP